MEPAVDAVRLDEPARFLDRVGQRELVGDGPLLTEQPDEGLKVPTRGGEKAAVAPARAPADDVLLHERDPDRGLAVGQCDRRPETGEPAADDADVGGDSGGERRTGIAGVVPERLLEPKAPGGARIGKVRPVQAAILSDADTLAGVRRITVLYDDDCGFCRWSADWIRRGARGRADIAPIQSEEGQQLLRDVPAARRLDSMHAVTADGRVWSAGAAVPPILRTRRGGRPLAAIAERFPKVTDRVYRAVANRREAIGRRLGEKACDISSRS